jgi:hypothetical protein
MHKAVDLDLVSFLAERRARSFRWGVHDCATLCCDWVRLRTGRDVLAPWRGRYANRVGAARRARESRASNMTDIGDVLFGADRRVGVAQIKRGDIVLARGALAICCGQSAMTVTFSDGLIALPISTWTMGWTI